MHHDETAGTYSSQDKHHQSKLHYRILGDDVVIWYEKMDFFTAHRSKIFPKENDKFYLFGCMLQEKGSMVVDQNEIPVPLIRGAVFLQ